MSYAKIHNLYDARAQEILKDPECYALEKIHGTAAYIRWQSGRVQFSSGGEDAVRFRALFDEGALAMAFRRLHGDATVTVYGEAYGGTQQGQAWRYGDVLRFVAYEVSMKGGWRDVPTADQIVRGLGLRFVAWTQVGTDLPSLDRERDAPSVEAQRCGMGAQPREGVVLRPIVERPIGNERVIAKHKRKEERETATFREVDREARVVYDSARAYADEWVTAERMRHVASRVRGTVGRALCLGDMRAILDAMVDDVYAESQTLWKRTEPDGTAEEIGEVPDTEEVRKALRRAASVRYGEWMRGRDTGRC